MGIPSFLGIYLEVWINYSMSNIEVLDIFLKTRLIKNPTPYPRPRAGKKFFLGC
jgi:hypothetical protein